MQPPTPPQVAPPPLWQALESGVTELEIILVYLLLVAVLILRPWGLFGRPGAL